MRLRAILPHDNAAPGGSRGFRAARAAVALGGWPGPPAYWRPPAWAAAVAAVDALCWHDAPADVVGRWSHLPSWDQMLIRALIYRIATEVAAHGKPRRPDAYRPAIDLALALAR